MNSFTIKDLENLSGIKAHTIRIWELRYSFLKPSRTLTNIRLYSNEELKTVLNIALLNKYGNRISLIDKMSADEIRENVIALTQKEAQEERVINELVHYMIELDVAAFEKKITSQIDEIGIENTITRVIFSFMEKIGILWMTNHINPAQEHLITNILRQKLIVGIDGTSSLIKVDKTVLLFLPENEYHELGLLFMYFLLKCRGINVIYLGCNVPIADVGYVVKVKKPDYLYCHLTRPGHKFKFDRFLKHVTKNFENTPCIISGQQIQNYEEPLNPLITFKKSFADVMKFISNL